jgi:hypothetical protein
MVVLLVLFLPGSFLDAELELYGYFENRFYLLELPGETEENLALADRFKLGDYNRLRLNLRASPSEKISVNMAVDFFSFHGILQSPLGTYNGTGASPDSREDILIDLDRAYVDLYFKKFDISIGKQRLAMGVSYIWAPLDIFNRVNIFEPKEEKPGANAVRLYIPLGPHSSLTGIFSPEEDFRSSRSAIRAKTQLWGIDTALTFIRSGTTATSIYGLDLRGENVIGWWVEAGYFVAQDPDAAGYNFYNKDIKLVLGFDYTFPLKNGLYWLNEFYYDSTGEKNPGRYNENLVLSGRRFTLGRAYFFSMLRYSFNLFLSASFNYIGNWQKGDGSFILNPMIQYEISRDILISTGFYFPCGNKDGELRKNNSNVFFLWLKINF